MTHTTARAHYVGPNHTTTLPRRFVYLDSEANQAERSGARVQSFRLAVAAFDRRLPDDRGWSERTFETFKNTAAVWEGIDAVTRAKSRTVVVAHNLAYDLRITNGFHELPRLGWSMAAIKLDGGHAWASFTREGRTLMLVDSLSWLPYGLDKLAGLIGMEKCPLPPWEDSDDAWEARCLRDVEILAAVWRRLMQWIESADLGNWRPTGAGQSWSAFRHRFMTHELLVHEDDEAREAERRAAHTGRCEAWRHGSLVDGPFTEWDFTSAYAAVGASCDVPVRLLRRHGALSLREWGTLATDLAIVSDVCITTAVPVVPARHSDRIVWPIGTFRTTLWENEIALAIEHGAHVEIEQAWTYERAPALAEFCQWCLGQLDESGSPVDPIIQLAVKHFSRALVGRFGARWRRWAVAGEMDTPDVCRWSDQNGDDGSLVEMLQIGRAVWSESALIDAPDCLPQVMAWVMAECRVRLWRATLIASQEHVSYLDTDSLLVDAEGSDRLRAARVAGLRPKGTWGRVEVLGPRQRVLDGAVVAAGLPRNARKLGKRSFTAEVWRGIDTSLRHGEASTVVIVDRRQRLRGTDHRRSHLPGGATAPHTLSL